MKRVYYFCELPPPFGGVTVKNQLLIEEVFASLDDLIIVDFCKIKRNWFQLIPIITHMLKAYFMKDSIIYGLGSYRRLYAALKIQRILGGEKSLSKSVNIVMGGAIADDLQENPRLNELLGMLKINLVESEGIRHSLRLLGVGNVDVLPNPKPAKGAKHPIEYNGKLKCVFFSKICEEKGCRYIMDELGEMDDSQVSIDFYGHIDENIEELFLHFVADHSNVNYHGVFDASKHDVYAELNQYDVLLFPTTWMGEGVPGILIEAKMAGILPVVSDWRFNREIIMNKNEGIVLEDLNQGTLKTMIKKLMADRIKVNEGKWGSFQSRKRYSLENYKDYLLEIMR